MPENVKRTLELLPNFRLLLEVLAKVDLIFSQETRSTRSFPCVPSNCCNMAHHDKAEITCAKKGPMRFHYRSWFFFFNKSPPTLSLASCYKQAYNIFLPLRVSQTSRKVISYCNLVDTSTGQNPWLRTRCHELQVTTGLQFSGFFFPDPPKSPHLPNLDHMSAFPIQGSKVQPYAMKLEEIITSSQLIWANPCPQTGWRA